MLCRVAEASARGMGATGYAQWFERMLVKLGHELWVGDAAEIRAPNGAEAED